MNAWPWCKAWMLSRWLGQFISLLFSTFQRHCIVPAENRIQLSNRCDLGSHSANTTVVYNPLASSDKQTFSSRSIQQSTNTPSRRWTASLTETTWTDGLQSLRQGFLQKLSFTHGQLQHRNSTIHSEGDGLRFVVNNRKIPTTYLWQPC